MPHDNAYTWAAKRPYTVNTATRALEVGNVVAIEQLTPALEKAAAKAPTLLFAKHSDTVLRHLGIDDQVLRAVRTIIDKRQLDASARCCPRTSSRCCSTSPRASRRTRPTATSWPSAGRWTRRQSQPKAWNRDRQHP
ncbi:hypothetical protein [Micromonospora sp. NPDC023814]|uniref:hypothetical protein n=1 Tax=Micromonospora sp. NPDC023814 TaxID=3154596 RepID=UPI0033FF76BD